MYLCFAVYIKSIFCLWLCHQVQALEDQIMECPLNVISSPYELDFISNLAISLVPSQASSIMVSVMQTQLVFEYIVK